MAQWLRALALPQDPVLCSQHLHGSTQLTPGDLAPSAGLQHYCLYVVGVCVCVHACLTLCDVCSGKQHSYTGSLFEKIRKLTVFTNYS